MNPKTTLKNPRLPCGKTPLTLEWIKSNCDIDLKGCWLWSGSKNAKGYGVVQLSKRKPAKVHRVALELSGTVIPEGLVVDHLCRNRSRCNPEHLECVSVAENTLRGGSVRHIGGKCWRCDSTNLRKRRKGSECLDCASNMAKAKRAAARLARESQQAVGGAL